MSAHFRVLQSIRGVRSRSGRDVGDVADAVADLAGCDAFVERLFGHFQQAAGRGCDVADGEGVALVAVVSVEFDYGVDAYYVAFRGVYSCSGSRGRLSRLPLCRRVAGNRRSQTGRTAAVIEHIFARNCIEPWV